MPPTPCQHCGCQFMRISNDPNALRLCNNCQLIKERKIKKEDVKSIPDVNILIKCPSDIQSEIEEFCMREGISFSKYFLMCHERYKKIAKVTEEIAEEYAIPFAGITPKKENIELTSSNPESQFHIPLRTKVESHGISEIPQENDQQKRKRGRPKK